MTTIEWTKKARKQLVCIPEKDVERIIAATEKLLDFPNVSNVKNLVNRCDYRLRVGRYRILFSVNQAGILTVILVEEVKKT